MAFSLRFTGQGLSDNNAIKLASEALQAGRDAKGRGKTSKAEGLFKQVNKALRFLRENPRHPGLRTHEYSSLEHPWDRGEKVWEAYARNKTPGAYRSFWCFGPKKGELTILAITLDP